MGLRIGDIIVIMGMVGIEYEIMDIDDSRPVKFVLEGTEFRQDILFRNPEGCFNDTSWAGSLEDMNRRLELGDIRIVNLDVLEPRKCGMKKIRL